MRNHHETTHGIGSKIRIKKGFTLVELMIALGILAIGVSMAAALFPVAIQFRRDSVNNALGTLICQNGLAIVKTKLTYSGNPFPSATLSPADLGNDAYYLGDSKRGFLTLGRQITGKNDYQIVIVSYGKSGNGNVAMNLKKNVVIANPGNVSMATFSNASNVQVGSPVILSGNGRWGKIVALNGLTATLDRKLPAGTYNVYVVSEDGAHRSPAMNVMATRTALPQ